MNLDNLTIQLLVVMAAAAAIGCMIGLSVMRLFALRSMNKLRNEYTGEFNKLEKQVSELNKSSESASDEIQQERKRSAAQQQQLRAQQDALKVHARLQAQRLSNMTTELQAAEEKAIRLESEFASFRANSEQERDLLRAGYGRRADHASPPVLNKRVVQQRGTHASARVDAAKPGARPGAEEPSPAQSSLFMRERNSPHDKAERSAPIISKELDIPSLAESELPDSVDDLEFELADFDGPDSHG